MNRTANLTLVITVVIANCAHSAERQVSVTIEKVQVHTMAERLAETFGQAVCFEDQRTSGGQQRTSPAASIRDLRVSLNMDKTTLTGSLARAAESIHNIRWEIDPATGMANVYPATNGWCDWTLPRLDIEGKTFKQVLIDEDPFGLKSHAIKFSAGRGSHSWLNKKVSLRIEGGMSARKALNALCALFPPGMRWQITTEQGVDGDEYGLLRLLYFETARDAQERRDLNLEWREWKDGKQLTDHTQGQ